MKKPLKLIFIKEEGLFGSYPEPDRGFIENRSLIQNSLSKKIGFRFWIQSK
jgi:hypothetical protein